MGEKTKISFDVANIHCFGSGYFGSRIQLPTYPDVPGSIYFGFMPLFPPLLMAILVQWVCKPVEKNG